MPVTALEYLQVMFTVDDLNETLERPADGARSL